MPAMIAGEKERCTLQRVALGGLPGPTVRAAEAAGQDRETTGILALALHHDEQTVLTAIEPAPEATCISAADRPSESPPVAIARS